MARTCLHIFLYSIIYFYIHNRALAFGEMAERALDCINQREKKKTHTHTERNCSYTAICIVGALCWLWAKD